MDSLMPKPPYPHPPEKSFPYALNTRLRMKYLENRKIYNIENQLYEMIMIY
jgi:hypothetical protein